MALSQSWLRQSPSYGLGVSPGVGRPTGLGFVVVGGAAGTAAYRARAPGAALPAGEKSGSVIGRCFRAVDAVLDGSPKFIAIDEQPNHQVVHMLCLRKTDRPAYQPLDARAQVDMLALDFLRVCFPHRVLLG